MNDARVVEARSQMAAVREEHEKLSAALFAARGEADVAKVHTLPLCLRVAVRVRMLCCCWYA